MRIHIIAAALPPDLDGIGDYSAMLAAELAKNASVKVLTAQPEPAAIPGVPVETIFSAADPRSTWNIVRHIEADPPDWVLLQYNPFSYGRWGFNLHLPLVMLQIKRRCPGVRVAVMAHETFVPLQKWNWKFAIMTTWQRLQFRQLGRSADILFFSIEAWAQSFQIWFPKTPIYHLPIGSNIPREEITRCAARQRLQIDKDTIVVGMFGSAHVSRMISWVRDAAVNVSLNQNVLVLYLGPDSQQMRRLLDPLPVIADGPLPADEVSRRLAAVDIYLAPFDDGISTRRGTLMTGLEHGLAIVGTSGHLTDAMLVAQNEQAFLLSDSLAPADFSSYVVYLAGNPARRQMLGQHAESLYRDEFNWPRIAQRLLRALS